MLKNLTSRPEAVVAATAFALFLMFWALIGEAWINDLPSLLRDVSWLGIVAIGSAIVIVSGEFDLSVGSVYAFVSMIFLMLMQSGISPALAFLLSMALACSIGALSGYLVWRFKLPSLLLTLGFLFVYRGLVEWITEGFPLSIAEEIQSNWLLQLLGGKTLGLHNSIGICLVLVIFYAVAMAKARFGNHVHAVGDSEVAASANGIPVGLVKVKVFTIGAMLAGFAGVISAANLSSVSTTTASAMEFEAIAAVVIGGVSLLGGAGTVWGAVLGVFTLITLKHALILMGVNIFAYQIVLGVVLVGVVALKGVVPKLLAAEWLSK
jgi:simple sugar transport system permease protein